MDTFDPARAVLFQAKHQVGASAPQAGAAPAIAPSATPAAQIAPMPPPTSVAPIPVTAQDLADLVARRSELSTQLHSANDRRDELSHQLRSVSDPVDRAGLQQRIATLDQRINQIESDMAMLGRQISQAPASARHSTGTSIPDMMNTSWGPPLTGVFMLVVLGPLCIAFAARVMRRGVSAKVPPKWPETTGRLERMEQAVEAIAIEIERVSEGQRFMTRVLTEQPARAGMAAPVGTDDAVPDRPALGAGTAPFEDVVVREREAAR